MKHSKLLLVFCLILGMAAYFSSCEKKYDNNEVIYKGTVINTVTQKPFANTEVKVTDGEHINASVKTDENGQFSILVKFNEINGNYYLLIGDASCAQVRREFKGFGQSEINLGDIEVEGPKAATITTKPVSNITAESAMSGGNITDDGRAEITARGVCWSKKENPTINDSHTTNGTGKGEFESEIRGLEGGSTYYVRAYATNSIGTVYGEQFKFSTETGFPVVTTGTISNVTATSASCGGSITDDAGYQITACGVCWSTATSYPTIENSHTSDVAANGIFKSVMENLERNTTYYVRAYATNKNGTSYGETISFITITGIPVVKTESITNVMALSAMGKGNIIDNAGYAITSCGFCWSSTNTMPTISGEHTAEIALTGAFDSYMDNLERNTTYYARAYATNNMGTGFGEVVTFTTTSGVPVVKTAPVTDILALSVTGNGEILDDFGYSITECGFCWSKTNSKPSINDSYSTEFATLGKFSGSVSNLEKNTSYYLRAYAKNKIGISYGETVTFTTILGLPVVRTGNVSDILASSAICTGEILTNSGYNISACGFCWSNTNPYPSTNDSFTSETVTSGVFSSKMMNLEHSTIYYVRAYATNDKGTGYGETQTFSTISGLPIVTTGTISNVLATSAVCSGTVSLSSEFAITARGVCWSSTTATPTIENEHTSEVPTIGNFSSSLSNLEVNTKYYVRAYATNSKGTSYGETVSLTTISGLPIVTTGSVSNVLATSAVCSATVSLSSEFAIKARGVCWSSTTATPTIENEHTSELPTTGNFTSTLSNLEDDTKYYVRAYATNAKGTSYGETISFTTISGLPVVTTGSIGSVQASSAKGGGFVADNVSFPIKSCGLCWSSTTATPTIEDMYTNEMLVSGSFTSNMVGLDANTTYYVRAYAINDKGISYGDITTFTTKNGLPEVKTTAVGENLTSTTITTGGQIISDGGFIIMSRGVVYGTLPYPTIEKSQHTTDGSGSGYFSSLITNVNTSSATYYIRSYATNKNGTSYGEQIIVTPEMYDYTNLKTMKLGGFTYRIYFGLGNLSVEEANAACENLDYGGFSDWVMPNESEGQAILEAYGVWGTKRNLNGNIEYFWIKSSYGDKFALYRVGDCYDCYWYPEYRYNELYFPRANKTIAIRKYIK